MASRPRYNPKKYLESAEARIEACGKAAILNTREAAAILGRKPATLQDWRLKKKGPRWMGPSAHYRYADLVRWMDENTVGTADQPLTVHATEGGNA